MNTQTYTLTFGDCAENHRSMQIIGNAVTKGISIDMLKSIQSAYKNCELINLNTLLDEKSDDAFVLVVRNGVDQLLSKGASDALFNEHLKLEKDKKAFMYGRVVNKKARHNLCFSNFSQTADYANGKGTIVKFSDVPVTNELRNAIAKITGNNDLQCEGNYYYDINNTYIGYHGDTERKIVIGARIGADFPLHYQWYYKGDKVGKHFEIVLKHGDIYFMSEKAVGFDWKTKNKYTLRHAAGHSKFL